MAERLYFAYGSNINLEQMAVRCPAAQVVGPAVLDLSLIHICKDTGSMTQKE